LLYLAHKLNEAVTELQQILAQNVKHYRKAKGIHQAQLGEQTGIGQARLSRIENRQLDVGVQTIEKLAQGLNVSPSTLLFDRSNKENSVIELLQQVEQLSPVDQKLVEAILESLLEKSRLQELHSSKVKDRLRELGRLRDNKEI